ncbi:MAG TPA: proline--tRNA ligase [Burkholderiales bacterium]|nr:proline--tRNA ligase [Burkholderiales bacterium]
MRVSQFFLSTLKEAPAEAELASHRLMLRAGLIKRLTSGIYTWMPLGLRVLRKVETIVREEMDRSGAIELLMPAVQPAELWQESKRWEQYGPELLRIKDRHQRDFCFGPTHEEVITDIVRREIRSYRQLPLNFYQIQTKFRDEIRPRFGVMRAREFVMKDAYSFHADKASLDQTYQLMYHTYSRIFTRLGLRFRAVVADTGTIGGTGSHEFHVLADSGEDAIAFCPDSDYAANVELAEALPPTTPRAPGTQKLQKVATPGKKTVEEVSEFLKVSPQKIIKSIMVMTKNNEAYLLLLRGDHALNEAKALKIPALADGFRLASEEEIQSNMHCRSGYIGPANTHVPALLDRSVASMSDFICGANEDGCHFIGANFDRDVSYAKDAIFDLRNVVAGDPSPDGKGKLEICRGVEVGHIFQLRTKYSSAMNCTFVDEKSETQTMEMGCYGIGVSRIVGAAIEQNHDERGIIFPGPMAPFHLAIVPIGKSNEVRAQAEKLHAELSANGIEVLLDDRDERAGVMFADMELIGIPHRLVIGERGLKQGQVEYQGRRDKEPQPIPLRDCAEFIKNRLCAS